jgi:hypothetical protein
VALSFARLQGARAAALAACLAWIVTAHRRAPDEEAPKARAVALLSLPVVPSAALAMLIAVPTAALARWMFFHAAPSDSLRALRYTIVVGDIGCGLARASIYAVPVGFAACFLFDKLATWKSRLITKLVSAWFACGIGLALVELVDVARFLPE